MKIHNIVESSLVNGPVESMVIWVQGCKLACPGCWNPETWSMTGGGEYYSVNRLVGELDVRLRDTGIPGLVFSGGEPMHQAAELEKVLTTIHWRFPKLAIGMYTGYTDSELLKGEYYWKARAKFKDVDSERAAKRETWVGIRHCLDFAVMGRYNQQWPSTMPMLGSANQKLCLFSNRFVTEDFPEQQFELNIGETALVQLTGFPPAQAKKTFV
jgi:anaerobic ribonucleoside-triphosphate reductase activating protein